MSLLNILGIDTDVICQNLADKVRPKGLPKIAVFTDKKTGDLEDVCEIHYGETGTMSPVRYLVDSLKLAHNLEFAVEGYESIDSKNNNISYSTIASKYYDVEMISEKELDYMLVNNSKFKDFNRVYKIK